MELKGKTVNFLGDSITEGIGVSDRANSRYDNVLKRECGFAKVNNYGISGTRLAHQSLPSAFPSFDLCFCGRAYYMDPDADIVVVYGGTNDYLHGDAPIGEYGDRTPATFYGAVRFLMQVLKQRYKDKTVVFLTPARCRNDLLIPKGPNKREDKLPLLGYVDIIKRTALDLDVPVLDLYRGLGIDLNDENEREVYAPDGLHFNEKGHARLAAIIKEFLESL